MTAQSPQAIDALAEISGSYDVILSDVWGVIHNGRDAYPDAVAALKSARAEGKAVILVTNAPRLAHEVEEMLVSVIGAPRSTWDGLVTSGDVTRGLIAEGPRRVFHLGPDRDLGIYDGLDAELVEEFEAQAVVCTGLFDDETESPDDYADMLRRLRARDLPFICANPDIMVERGDRLIWCAGALARDYAQLGGRTLIAGKPHAPIYDAALAAAGEVLGREVKPSDVLAIGDGVLTDIKGAAGYGIDSLFVTHGIHASEYASASGVDAGKLAAFLGGHGLVPLATMPRLR